MEPNSKNNEIPIGVQKKSQRAFCYAFLGISALTSLTAGLYDPKLSVTGALLGILPGIYIGLKLAEYVEKKGLAKMHASFSQLE